VYGFFDDCGGGGAIISNSLRRDLLVGIVFVLVFVSGMNNTLRYLLIWIYLLIFCDMEQILLGIVCWYFSGIFEVYELIRTVLWLFCWYWKGYEFMRTYMSLV
jgi:hypothetical protein